MAAESVKDVKKRSSFEFLPPNMSERTCDVFGDTTATLPDRSFQTVPNMNIADKLLDKIYSFVELQKECADKLDNLATELEEHKKNVNISKTVGSSVSVGGAIAMTAAGILTIFTGGAAIPLLAITGGIVTGLGVATSVGSEVANAVISSRAMKDTEEILKKIQDHVEGIQKLVDLLEEEGKKQQQQAADEDYVVEQILRAMAKLSGLVLNVKIKLRNMLSVLSKKPISGTGIARSLLVESLPALGLISKFVIKAIASVGTKTAAKAFGRVGGGAVGLIVSVPELIIDVKNLVQKKCKTEASKTLRENAEALQKAYEEIKQDLDRTKNEIEKLARVQRSVKNTNRSSDDKKTLTDFAKELCEDETARRWLRENSESDSFSQLVDMFHFLEKHIDKEEKKDHSDSVHITFVAHGCIEGSMIPASCLLPLSSITDVILYSPWNCTIDADVVYGVATGRIKPQQKEFYRGEKQSCGVPGEKHQPTKLPDCWNSMKKAGDQKIPNITLSPQKPPEDGTWKRIVFLKKQHGQPGTNRIVIPFILPAGSSSLERVPFSVVTLALSLVLLSSRFKATVHLTACLRDHSAVKFDQEYLKQQYACCINDTWMKCSPDKYEKDPDLQRAFKAVFG